MRAREGEGGGAAAGGLCLPCLQSAGRTACAAVGTCFTLCQCGVMAGGWGTATAVLALLPPLTPAAGRACAHRQHAQAACRAKCWSNHPHARSKFVHLCPLSGLLACSRVAALATSDRTKDVMAYPQAPRPLPPLRCTGPAQHAALPLPSTQCQASVPNRCLQCCHSDTGTDQSHAAVPPRAGRVVPRDRVLGSRAPTKAHWQSRPAHHSAVEKQVQDTPGGVHAKGLHSAWRTESHRCSARCRAAGQGRAAAGQPCSSASHDRRGGGAGQPRGCASHDRREQNKSLSPSNHSHGLGGPRLAAVQLDQLVLPQGCGRGDTRVGRLDADVSATAGQRTAARSCEQRRLQGEGGGGGM